MSWVQKAKDTYELWNKQQSIIRAWTEPYALLYGDTWEFVVMSHTIINRDELNKCINLRTNMEVSLDNH